jgi:8-oxo-dGTP pyrophosphatase MutT (NUDIX family)
MTISVNNRARARIVTALLRDGNRMLLCHRSADRRWYPDVWDLPGGHVEDGELPGAALVRELREELAIVIAEPSGPPMREIRADTFEMQIWLIDTWTGTPINAAPEEHDAIAWFEGTELADLHLAHESYLPAFTAVLSGRRNSAGA